MVATRTDCDKCGKECTNEKWKIEMIPDSKLQLRDKNSRGIEIYELCEECQSGLFGQFRYKP